MITNKALRNWKISVKALTIMEIDNEDKMIITIKIVKFC